MNSGALVKLIVVALLLLLPALPALAHEIVVDAAGTCSFPDAFASANNDDNRGGCTRVDDGNGSNDTIILEKNVSSGGLVMSATASLNRGNITIEGKGYTYTMNVNHDRHFDVGRNRLTINNLILTRAENTGRAGVGGSINLSGTSVTIPASLVVNDSVFHGNLAWDEGGAINVGPHKEATINRTVFYNNTSNKVGSAISLEDKAHLIVSNSSFYNNNGKGVIAPHDGTGGPPDEITLRHVTIFGNSGSGGGLRFATAASKLEMSNSIDVSNAGGACQLTATLPTDTTLRNNIVGSSSTQNCKDGANTVVADPMLPNAAGVTTLLHLIPQAGSPAIDAISAADCEAVFGTADKRDVRGTARPQNGKCDIGAYEYVAPPPPPRDTESGSGGGASASPSGSGSDDEAMPTAVAVIRYSPAQSCQSLQPSIVVSKASSGTSCQLVSGSGIGHPEVIAAMPSLVVDIWGWVTPGTQVCFLASSGAIKFIDTTALPRTVADLSVFSEAGGLLCATVDGAGQVALVPGPSAPPVATPSLDTQLLGDCMVTLQYSLNFRDAPAGEKIGALPSQVKLTALERTDSWFKVDYHGAQGWISAAYVEPEDDCG